MKINGNYAEYQIQKPGREAGNAEGILPDLKEGQIIEGIIREVSDKVTIDFSGRELKFPKDTVHNAKEGDIRKFKIMEASEKGIVLKEIGSVGKEGINPLLSTKVETDPMHFIETPKQEEEKEEKTAEELSEEMPQEEAAADFLEFRPLEKYNMERLERTVARMKQQKAFKTESLKGQTESIKKEEERIQRAVIHQYAEMSGAAGLIAEKLVEAGLPLTEDNIKNMEAAMKIAETTPQIHDNAKIYLIRNGLAPTIRNLYKAEHSGTKIEKPQEGAAWNELESQAEKIIRSAGLPVDEKTVQDAKWLFDNKLLLTKDNLLYKQALEEVRIEDCREACMEYAAALAGIGEPCEDADLTMPGRQKTEQIIREWQSVSETAVQLAVEKTGGTAYTSLRDIQKEQSLLLQNPELEAGAGMVNIQEVTARRQLEEIRLKLSVESGFRLAMKGIHIDTDSMERVVEGLRELEDAYYQSLMYETDAASGTEEAALLKETTQKLMDTGQAPAALLAATFTRRDSIPFGTLALEGKALTEAMAAAGRAYETVMTVPRKDLGDSIQAAFQNIDAILADLHIAAQPQNQRAVRILSYNNMELTYDAIMQMKQYDAEVNDMLESMKPSVTAEFIKRGMNPLNMNLHEIQSMAEEIAEEISADDNEKYSAFLYRVEKQDGLTKAERDAYIGIYRLIHQVRRSDGAAIGSVIKAGRELTLSNLLTAVRTNQKNGVDASVDDGFGVLEGIKQKGTSITDQIASGLPSEEYGKRMLKKAGDQITPAKLSETAKEYDIMDMPLETLAWQLAGGDPAGDMTGLSYSWQRAEQLKTVLQNGNQAAAFLLGMQLEDSAAMIEAAETVLEEQGFYQELKRVLKEEDQGQAEESQVEQAADRIFSNIGNREELTAAYHAYCSEAARRLKEQMASAGLDSNQIAYLQKASGCIRLIGSLADRECYSVPVAMEQGIFQMNVTFRHGMEESGFRVSLTNIHGTAVIEADIREDMLHFNISAENPAGISELKGREAAFLADASEAGFEASEITYQTGIGSRDIDGIRNFFDGEGSRAGRTEGRTSTETLYRLAQKIIKTCIL